jgi:hypothetical protein
MVEVGRRAGRALPSCAHNMWWCTPVQEDQELEALAAAAAAALAAPVLAIATTAEVGVVRTVLCCWPCTPVVRA